MAAEATPTATATALTTTGRTTAGSIRDASVGMTGSTNSTNDTTSDMVTPLIEQEVTSQDLETELQPWTSGPAGQACGGKRRYDATVRGMDANGATTDDAADGGQRGQGATADEAVEIVAGCDGLGSARHRPKCRDL
ncbi:hypothetical protein ON010_g2050 [Phytophthora cinnamomi]|nr:hypothetical protein ON010_g2050 [Phytophthora cinnamomi]